MYVHVLFRLQMLFHQHRKQERKKEGGERRRKIIIVILEDRLIGDVFTRAHIFARLRLPLLSAILSPMMVGKRLEWLQTIH